MFKYTGSVRRLNTRFKLLHLTIVAGICVLFTWSLSSLWLSDSANSVADEKRLQWEIIKLSQKYVQVLAERQKIQPDGPYSFENTAYDMKKTLAVLLHNLMQRLSILEAELSSTRRRAGSLELSTTNFSIQNTSFQRRQLQQQTDSGDTVDFIDLLRGAQEGCVVQSYRMLAFPECQSKIEWLRTRWKSHPCYEQLGVDGSDCSIIRYLSEVEGHCPAIENRREALARPEAQIRYDLQGLLDQIPTDKLHPSSSKFMHDRLTRLWPELTEAMRTLSQWSNCSNGSTRSSNLDWFASLPLKNGSAGCPPLWNRPQLIVHLHLGFLSLSASKFFESSIGRGGPLGELVQWTDLLAALYMLGHQVTLSMELNPTLERLHIPEYGKTPCQFDRNLVDLIFTDIVGYRQLRKAGLRVPDCKFRILDSFGTEAAFNRAKNATWGGLRLNLQQFFTMFPHSPDNTFLGFMVEFVNKSRHVSWKTASGKPMALVYGKEQYMWKGTENYLRVLNEFLELHGNVADASSKTLPDFVHNHKRSYGQEYLNLLTSAQIMVGLGFPYEGPAPLEALANGLIFLNPHFTPPHGRSNTAFFADKPTNRKLTSQQPYIEKYVGEPHSYLVDMHNATALRHTMRRVLANLHASRAYRPFEFSPLGFIERLTVLLSHQSFCDGAAGLGLLQSPLPQPSSNQSLVANLELRVNSVRWPPTSSLRVVMATPGLSCAVACSQVRSNSKPPLNSDNPDPTITEYLQRRSLAFPSSSHFACPDCLQCSPEHFPTVNNRFTLEKHLGFDCAHIEFRIHPLAPFRLANNQTCVFQADRYWFDCTSSVDDTELSRICPCRDTLPHQSAICLTCL